METFDHSKREKEEIREEMEVSSNWKDVNMSTAFLSLGAPLSLPHTIPRPVSDGGLSITPYF